VHDWDGKVPVKDSVSNKSGRFYKDDQEVETLLLLQTNVKSWAHGDQQTPTKKPFRLESGAPIQPHEKEETPPTSDSASQGWAKW
jgi:hypothetical protein